MFDSASERLIRSVPQLEGINTENLPQIITDGFLELTLIGVRANNGDAEEQLTSQIKQLRRLAITYEALVDRGTEGETRRAAAFVAGTAYRLLANLSPRTTNKNAEEFLTKLSIDASIAAPLLFLIAEQHPDAREISQGISGKWEGNFVRVALIESIHDIGKENLDKILDRAERLSSAGVSATETIEEQAATTLYGICWTGIVQMAANILGKAPPITRFSGFSNAAEAFDRVLALSVEDINSVGDNIHYLSTYSGPRHLARLLKHLSQKLEDASVTKLAVPEEADKEIWQKWLSHRALSKPILWHNHRTSLNTNFHAPGHSGVLVLPTGAGKTTLSEIKIASTIASGKNVVFLVPTLALVDQLTRDLEESFPEDVASAARAIDADFDALFIADDSPSIQVMTPERCLALQSFAGDTFDNIGLLILDECHILSPESGRRGIDAMLCVLQTFRLAPDADILLLSAMITNANELAEWIQSETGRPCYAIEDSWKPSRQARGIVVYESDEYRRKLNIAKNIKNSGPRKGKEAERAMTVTPYGLFGLSQEWAASAQDRSTLIQILDHAVNLTPKYEPRLYATPNSNEVAKEIAVATSKNRMKTIVFVQNKDWTISTSRKIAEHLSESRDVVLSSNQEELYDALAIELGGVEYSYIQPPFNSVPHNSYLIPLERRLAENLFKWPKGASVIVATPTLSQGMNLPAQVVIIAADTRHDEETGRSKNLEVHEILNAAGRAGRAGHMANGIVIMIPGKVLDFRGDNIPQRLIGKLQTLLPENDKCLEVIDPLATTLDRLQAEGATGAQVEYTVRRAALGAPSGEEQEYAETLTKRSLGAFHARKQNQEDEFTSKIAAFVEAVASEVTTESVDVYEIAVKTGLPSQPLLSAMQKLKGEVGSWPTDVCGWIEWFFNWLATDVESYEALLSDEYGNIKKVTGGEELVDFVKMKPAILAWVSGESFVDIERTLIHSDDDIGNCDRARVIASNFAPRVFTFLFGTIGGLVKKVASEQGIKIPSPAVLECLPTAIRKGFDRPAKVALAQLHSKILSRVQIHHLFESTFENRDFLETTADYKTVYSLVASELE